MAAVLILPFPIGLYSVFGPSNARDLLASSPLIGEPAAILPPRPTISNLWSGTFQRAVEPWIAHVLFARGLIIRLTNQLYYDIFLKSYMYNGNIIVGKQGTLYEAYVIKAACQRRVDPAPVLDPIVDGLVRLRAALTKLGRTVIFVTTPSKAVTMPELLPSGPCRSDPPFSASGELVTKLRNAGIPVIDGIGMARTMKMDDPLPPFPRGGTHWSNLVGARIAAQIMREINKELGHDLGDLTEDSPRWNAPPEGTDADLASLLNLYWPPLDYATGKAETHCRTTPAGRDTAFVAVSGSFAYPFLFPLAGCHFFKSVDLYFYYDQLLDPLDPPGDKRQVDRKTIDWRAIFSNRTVLIVELNEAFLSGAPPLPWLGPFFEDAERALSRSDPVGSRSP